jgi:8-oxo-dGTP diphosphatase
MRTAVLAELQAVEPLDELESAHIADAKAWVQSGAQIYRISKPATPPKHLVSYFAVVAQDEILLVSHKVAQLWLPTGGHVECDEHPRHTVVREFEEELGVAIDPAAIQPPLMVTCSTTVGSAAGHTDVSLWYVVKVNRSQPFTFDEEEFHEIRWFKFSAVPFHATDPHLGRFLKKLRHAEA